MAQASTLVKVAAKGKWELVSKRMFLYETFLLFLWMNQRN